jgi:hypothetical protein
MGGRHSPKLPRLNALISPHDALTWARWRNCYANFYQICDRTAFSDAPQVRLNLRDRIRKQIGNGYVLEYVHLSARPNPNARPFTQEEKTLREKAAGALTAVYRLTDQSVHANKLVSAREFEEMQDRWDQRGVGSAGRRHSLSLKRGKSRGGPNRAMSLDKKLQNAPAKPDPNISSC